MDYVRTSVSLKSSLIEMQGTIIFIYVINYYLLQEAVGMVKPIADAEEAAKRLMQEAYQRGSGDNITIVVVRFLAEDGSSPSGSGQEMW